MLKSKILDDVFSKKLDVQCKSIGRIHRLGRPGKKRPVIIYFQDYNEKQQILKNAYKLKGTVISLQNYSHTTLKKRKLLWDSAKLEKQQGKKVSLKDDKLRVNDDTFIWDDTQNARINIRTHGSSIQK